MRQPRPRRPEHDEGEDGHDDRDGGVRVRVTDRPGGAEGGEGEYLGHRTDGDDRRINGCREVHADRHSAGESPEREQPDERSATPFPNGDRGQSEADPARKRTREDREDRTHSRERRARAVVHTDHHPADSEHDDERERDADERCKCQRRDEPPRGQTEHREAARIKRVGGSRQGGGEGEGQNQGGAGPDQDRAGAIGRRIGERQDAEASDDRERDHGDETEDSANHM